MQERGRSRQAPITSSLSIHLALEDASPAALPHALRHTCAPWNQSLSASSSSANAGSLSLKPCVRCARHVERLSYLTACRIPHSLLNRTHHVLQSRSRWPFPLATFPRHASGIEMPNIKHFMHETSPRHWRKNFNWSASSTSFLNIHKIRGLQTSTRLNHFSGREHTG